MHAVQWRRKQGHHALRQWESGMIEDRRQSPVFEDRCLDRDKSKWQRLCVVLKVTRCHVIQTLLNTAWIQYTQGPSAEEDRHEEHAGTCDVIEFSGAIDVTNDELRMPEQLLWVFFYSRNGFWMVIVALVMVGTGISTLVISFQVITEATLWVQFSYTIALLWSDFNNTKINCEPVHY